MSQPEHAPSEFEEPVAPAAGANAESMEGSIPAVSEPPTGVQHPLLAGYSGLLPFPRHWDGHLQQSSQHLFTQLRLDDAVRSATLRLEARLRGLCGFPPERIGVDLVNEAFKPNGGFLEQVSLPLPEREGLHALFRGAVQQIRNPVGHRDVNQLPGAAYDTLAFINYLLEVAQEAALARYVHPFLGKWGGPHVMETIHRCDLNGDQTEELVVITRTRYEVRALVLAGGGDKPMHGVLPRVAGAVAADPIFADLDGDGRAELILAAGERNAQGQWLWNAILVDSADDGTIRSFSGPAGEELVSNSLQFEVFRPMHLDSPVIAGLVEPGTYRFWKFNGNALTEQKDEAAPNA